MNGQGNPQQISIPRPESSRLPQPNGHVDLKGLNVSPEIKFLIQYGDTIGQYPTPSEALAAVLTALIDAGCEDDLIARLCLLESHGISGLPRQKGIAWFEDELKEARRKADSLARQADGEPEDVVDLQMDTIPPPRPIAQDLLYEGMLLFGGKSKRGKSWIMLDLAVSVATGTPVWGHFAVPEPQPVLYISLEDGRGRINRRVNKLPAQVRERGYLQILYNFPMFDQGGMKKLQGYVKSCRYRLIIIDVLAKVEPAAKRRSEKTYLEIYDMFAPIQDMQRENPTCLAMVTHLRKTDAEDIFDTLYGSVGYQGVQDALWVMDRPPQNNVAVVHTRPNDAEEQVLHVAFKDGHWKFLGHDEEIRSSQRRQHIRHLAKDAGDRGLNTNDVLKGLSQPFERYNAARQLLYRMVQEGELVRLGRGRYGYVAEAIDNHSGELGI